MMRGACALTGRSWLVISLIALGLTGGCSERSSRTDFVLRTLDGWTNISPGRVDVPGTPIQILEGPGNAKLAIYRTLPIPAPDAEALSHDVANRLQNLPGLRLVQRDVKRIQGRKAAWIEIVAPGNGRGIAPSGTGVPKANDDQPLEPTRQLLVGFPSETETLWMRWKYPDSAVKSMRPQIADALEAFRLSDPVVKSQTY